MKWGKDEEDTLERKLRKSWAEKKKTLRQNHEPVNGKKMKWEKEKSSNTGNTLDSSISI